MRNMELLLLQYVQSCPHFVPTFTANAAKPFSANAGVRAMPARSVVRCTLIRHRF